LFADDCLVFFKANPSQAATMREITATFEKGSGQLLSVNKSSILFSDSCSTTNQNLVRQILAISKQDFEDKYLGFTTPEGRMKKGKFQPSKDRLSKKLNNWIDQLMSMGAKDELIKSVAGSGYTKPRDGYF
jgi:hypothetical protein